MESKIGVFYSEGSLFSGWMNHKEKESFSPRQRSQSPPSTPQEEAGSPFPREWGESLLDPAPRIPGSVLREQSPPGRLHCGPRQSFEHDAYGGDHKRNGNESFWRRPVGKAPPVSGP